MYETHSVHGWSYFKVDTHGYDVSPTGPNGNKWPAVGVKVSFTAIIGAQLNFALTLTAGSDLVKAGFRAGANYYYTKTIRGDYVIKSMAW